MVRFYMDQTLFLFNLTLKSLNLHDWGHVINKYSWNNEKIFSLSDVPVSSSEKMYSGLYEYHIPSNTWTKRRDDVGQVPTSGSGQATSGFRHELKSRSSHSMLFHKELRKLFIFGGQRKGSEYLNDFFRWEKYFLLP